MEFLIYIFVINHFKQRNETNLNTINSCWKNFLSFFDRKCCRIYLCTFFKLIYGDHCAMNLDKFHTPQKMKFAIKDFFSKCDQIHSFLRVWLHLLNTSFMENFIFCAV